MNSLLLLAGAGFCAGAMNALAGGGSFVSLPALIAAGVPSVLANASSTVALFPGGLASAWTYRAGVRSVCGIPIWPMLAVTFAGGLLGSLALLHTPASTFDAVLPWLLLWATLSLAFGKQVGQVLRAHVRIRPAPVLLIQLALGFYGGYFGGAVGIMMMAVWGLLDTADLSQLNPPRTLLVSAANSIAVLSFIIAGAVAWAEVLVMMAAGIAGGFMGARVGRRLGARLVRAGTLLLTAGMTVLFFLRAYGR